MKKIIELLCHTILKEKNEQIKHLKTELAGLKNEKEELKDKILNYQGKKTTSDTFYDFTSEFFKLYCYTIYDKIPATDCSSVADLFRSFLILRFETLIGDQIKKAGFIYQYLTNDTETVFILENKNIILDKLLEQTRNWKIDIVKTNQS